MAIISVNNVSLSWDGKAENVFENLSFTMDTDWRTGLIGRNGRGKTTLLRLLADAGSGSELHPCGAAARAMTAGGRAYSFSGTISSPAGFRYFPYYVTDEGADTLAVIDGICPDYEFWELCRELNMLGVSEDSLFRPFHTLSPGERTKTLLATLFLGRGDFVLLDEPTNHLDAEGTDVVVRYLRSKKGFLMASHDRAVLDELCDHIVSLGRSGVELMNGNYSVWAEEKLHRDRRSIAENERLEKDIRKLKAAARRTAEWSDKLEQSKYGQGPVDRGYIGHKAAKLMKRSKALDGRRSAAIEEKEGLLKDIDRTGGLKLNPLEHHANSLVELRGLRISYLPHKSFELLVSRGERVALSGGNGAGKSSIIKLLAGEPVPHTGTVKTASGLSISYVPQEPAAMSGSIRRFAREAEVDLTQLLAIMVNLGVPREAFDADISKLSDGQKRKALLARSLCESAHLYIWDEPLNYIDILSREQLESLLLEYSPTMIFVEHDEFFIRRLASRVVEL